MTPNHGFVWPEGLPSCTLCKRDANDLVHVTPAPANPYASAFRFMAAAGPVRAHAYLTSVPRVVSSVLCVACNEGLSHRNHPAGLASGHGVKVTRASESAAVEAAEERISQRAFVGTFGNRVVLAAPGREFLEPDTLLPREVASSWSDMSTKAPQNLWIHGRYVEADRPNRNSDFWSTEDLELGHPTVKHGPINWLHDEREIIGSLAATELVRTDRALASTAVGAAPVGNHIVALGAIWPYLRNVRERADAIRTASENGKLWFSMECVSRNVACLLCDHKVTYRDFLNKEDAHCEHMRAGAPRRFEDPVFEGAGIIVPPYQPGWSNADARVVMPRASAMAERQAAAFDGLTTTEAEQLVAQLLITSGEPTAVSD